jgi:hypothetical protein
MEAMKSLRRLEAWVRSAIDLITRGDQGLPLRRDAQRYSCGCSRANLLVVPDVMAYAASVCNERWHEAE